jgi:hypothetical protein
MRSDGDGEIVAATIAIGDPAKPVLQGKAVTNPVPDEVDGHEGECEDDGETFVATGELYQGAASPPQDETPAAPGAEPSEPEGDPTG